MAFTAYLDDSGTGREHPVAIGSVIVIPAKLIPKLDENWKRFLDKQGIPNFHAAACAAPTSKEGYYNGWSDAKRRHVFMRVSQFCKRFGVQVYGFAVHKKTYDALVPEEFRHYGGDYYTWALRNVLKKIHEWKARRGIEEPIEHIFDWQEIGDPVRDEIEDLIGQYAEFDGEIHHDFQKRKLTPALQCADLIAWICFQLAMEKLHGKPMNPYADEVLKVLETYRPSGEISSINKRWFQLITIEERELKFWINLEMRTGVSLAKFKDWYQRHPNREVLLNARKNRVSKVRPNNAPAIAGSARGNLGKTGREKK